MDYLYLTDTHCHLDFESFDQDREMVLERARATGIGRILNPGIDLGTSRAALRLTDYYPEIFAAVGVHPNNALSWDQNTYRELEELALSPKVVAIGEIGLDYYRNGAPVDVQQMAFLKQLELAGNLGLPVILHSRGALIEMQSILMDWVKALSKNKSRLIENPGVLHSYSGDWITAKMAIENNFYIGITGPVTYRNASQLHEVVENIPLEKVLVETDAPFLPPHPHRGERNEPSRVAIIAGKIAELRTIDKEEVVRITTRNAARLFCWREMD